jgi:predicted SAM-dependent methyltransferase
LPITTGSADIQIMGYEMIGLLRCGRRIINSLLSPFGIEVVRINKTEIPDINFYEEQSRPEQPLYINIGAGSFSHPYWHNIDIPNDYYSNCQKGNIHIHHDLTSHRPLPIVSNTLKAAYTSHVIEHVRDMDVEFLFQEVYRCLKPGGYFRIACPDIDLEYDAFLRGDYAFWKWPNAYGIFNTSIEQKFLDHFATALTKTHPEKSFKKFSDKEILTIFTELPKEEALNYFINQLSSDMHKFYPGDHINWFNFNKIASMLKKANFTCIYESRYGQSHYPVLRDKLLFDSTCPEISLYAECQK